MLVIFLTVFIDLIGFGIVLPLLPLYGERYGAEGAVIGGIISAYSIMQFFVAPWWGRLSDRIGRRPVLLISTAGAAISYAVFGLSALPGLSAGAALGLVLASRLFAGACGANISVASAYIADITPRQSRSKGMALIGVSFGLGFILGPAIGGLSASKFGLAGPGWVAAGFCSANFLLAWFILGESRQPNSEHAATRPRVAQWGHTLRQPKLGLLITLYFLSTFCFTCLECTLPLLVGSSNFHPDDFTDPSGLATKLVQGADPVSAALRDQLAPGVADALRPAAGDNAAVRYRLFTEFNRLLESPQLLDAATRARIALGPEARRLLAHPVPKGSTAHLNRLLLEDAYPAEISRQRLYFDERHVGYLFAYCGLVSALIQGGTIGRLVKRLGEPRLIVGSLLLVAVSLALLPYAPGFDLGSYLFGPASAASAASWGHRFLGLAGLLVTLGLFSVASALNRPPTLGMISIHSPAEEQGATLGVAQSAGTLARVLAPVLATGLYAVHPHSPYFAAAAISLVAGLLAWRYLEGQGASAAAAAASSPEASAG